MRIRLSEGARYGVFRIWDEFRGAPLRTHIKDLRLAFENPRAARKLADDRLGNILRHAVSTTPFYRDLADFNRLEDFPILQKKTIKENYRDFLSRAYNENDLKPAYTSGSYGTPFKFYLTQTKRARQQAEILFFTGWAGYRVGMRYVQIRTHPQSRFVLFMQNGSLIDPCRIDEEWLERQRHLLIKKRIRYIIGYPTSIIRLADFCRTRGDTPDEFQLEGIIAIAETLFSKTRDDMEQVYGCPVLSRYAANELGIIAHECPEERKQHINFATHKVELLSHDSDQPITRPGESGRVVITDYFSHAMPLIRYDIGDIAAWTDGDCSCGLEGPAFESIEGRIVEALFDPRGTMISPQAIDRITKRLNKIVQFQFIQQSEDTYLIKLLALPSFSEEDLLLEDSRALFTSEAKIKLEYVDSIPPLPSGKRPYIINEFRNRMSR